MQRYSLFYALICCTITLCKPCFALGTTNPPVPENCRYIILSGLVDKNWQLLLVDIVSRNYQALSDNSFSARDPALSPDRRFLAYSARLGQNWDIYVLDLYSGERRRLTDHPAYDGRPAWSPDGQSLLFESNRSGVIHIFQFSLQNEEIIAVTSGQYPDTDPIWLSDGRHVVFSSWRSGMRQLFRQHIDDGSVVPITDIGEEPQQISLSAQDTLVYVRDGQNRLEVVLRDITTNSIHILPVGAALRWPSLTGQKNQTLVGLTAFRGTTGEYPVGWQLVAIDLAGNHQQSLLSLRGEWEQPVCVGNQWHGLSAAWFPISKLNLTAYLASLDPPGGAVELIQLNDVQAPNPRLASAVAPFFLRLRQRILEETGFDFLGVLNDAWRGLDHPGGKMLSWHKAGRAFDMRDWFAPDQQRLFIAREQIDDLVFFRIYILARRQDGSQGRPLRVSLWQTEGRLGDSAMLAQGGRYRVPPNGFFVDITELATIEGWTRIPAHTPPRGNWKYRYIDMEFWHYERRGGLRLYDALVQLYGERAVQMRYTVKQLLEAGYDWQEIERLGFHGRRDDHLDCNKKETFWFNLAVC